MGEFSGKVAIVTGASTGIGAATAKMLSNRGASVICASRTLATLNELVSEINRLGGAATAIKADVGIETDVQQMVDAAIDIYGRLDYAVNNAGYSPPVRIVDMTMEEFDKTSETNFRGAFQCLKYQIPRMIESGGGSVVNIASASAHRGTPGLAAYGATKHALLGLTKSAALEYAVQNVRVNLVSPGAIFSDMFNRWVDTPELLDQVVSTIAMGRVGEPDEVANAITFLLSDKAAYITGAVLNVDGGLSAGFAARKV